MHLVRLNDDADGVDPALAHALLEAVGTEDFAARVLAAVAPCMAVSHCTVFALRDTGRVEAVSTASAVGEVAALTAIEYMRLGFDRQDSNMRWLAKRKPAKRRQLWVGHQFAEEVADEEYRRVCYGETGIRERLSLAALYPGGVRVAVSFYRNHSYPEYTLEHVDWLGQQAAWIATAVFRHVQVQHRAAPHAALASQRIAALPARERELVAHVLAGCTTKEAARRMGVALTTAATYRLRAFQHLGIRSHRELPGLVGGHAA